MVKFVYTKKIRSWLSRFIVSKPCNFSLTQLISSFSFKSEM
jgi:hypothetical protein